MSSAPINIKIYVSCHKDSYVPTNKLLFPVQVGTSINGRYLPDMLHDDEGDNISSKNKSYCELTAQYWAWKNDDADYYGFFHYRRYFSFADKVFDANAFGEIVEEFNDDETLKKYCLDQEKMASVIGNYDLIVPVEGGFADKKLTLYKQYENSQSHFIRDMDFVLDIIKRDYPEMYRYALEYINRNKGYFCNMFIMKKDIFFRYSEWLFSILKEHEKNIDISDYSEQAYRVHGYLAERLCGIYIYYLEKTSKYKIKKLQKIFFKNADKEEKILPAFEHDNKTLVLSANDFYAPYLSVVLQSVKDNSCHKNNYDIIVLHTDISEKNRILLQKQCEAENFSLRFFDVRRRMKKYENLPLRGHFRVETYFRILLPEIFDSYSKVLYLDSDMVVCDDIAKLFDTDIEGYLLAACRDADTAGLYNGFEPGKKKYMDEVLKIAKPYDYFQAGTILFNLDEFRKTYSVEQIMTFAMSYNWDLLDQDVLNYFAQGRVKFADMAWNVMMDWNNIRINQIISLAPHYLKNEYMQARKNPKIIHFAGPDKPWENPSGDFAEEFWHYSRKTVYYEEALLRMSLKAAQTRGKEPKKSFVRKVADKLLPIGTGRREFVKKLIGKGKKRG